jgi:hypothetical protein
MLFCLGVYLVVRGKNWLYYILYPIAALNRETICFLTVFFVIWKWQELRALGREVMRKDILSLLRFLLPVVWFQRRWIQNPGIYWSCKILISLWFVGMFIAGLLKEIRVSSELSALLAPALGLIVYHRFVPVPAEDCSGEAGSIARL